MFYPANPFGGDTGKLKGRKQKAIILQQTNAGNGSQKCFESNLQAVVVNCGNQVDHVFLPGRKQLPTFIWPSHIGFGRFQLRDKPRRFARSRRMEVAIVQRGLDFLEPRFGARIAASIPFNSRCSLKLSLRGLGRPGSTNS